jgi:gentisate 1,2-dioxygenase
MQTAEQRARLLDALHEHQLLGLWERERERTERPPGRPAAPYLWRAAVLNQLLAEAADLIAIDEGQGRRVLQLMGPGLDSTTGILQLSLQLIKPGETAAAHRHAISAIRFIVAGSGAYTTIAGAQFPLAPRDLLVTPSLAWHDHGAEGPGNVTWLDILDSPLVRFTNLVRFQLYHAEVQTPTAPPAAFSNRGALLAPTRGRLDPTTLPLHYRWDDAWPQLRHYLNVVSDPFDGALLHYAGRDGGFTIPTVDCRLQALAPRQATRRHRHASATAYYVLEGQGRTVVGDTELMWEAGDAFVVPSWAWHEHMNRGAEVAVLFSADDRPTLQNLGLYWEEEA